MNNEVNTMEKENIILGGLNLNYDNPDKQNSVAVITDNEVAQFSNNYQRKLRNNPEVQNLTGTVCLSETTEILNFGQQTSESISSVSDRILHSMKGVNQEEIGEVLVQLTKIMKKFDIKDFSEIKEPGLFEKIFKKVKNSVESLLARYETMGSEVDKLTIILKKYEVDLVNQSKQLGELYNANLEYYKELEKYIVAGELIKEELRNVVIPQYQAKADESGDGADFQAVQKLEECYKAVDERVYDLRLAENVALQSMPMIQQIQKGNFDLLRTIKSSLIVSLPVFKSCLIQAVTLKRQELMKENIQAVRDATNELLIRNAQNTSKQSLELAKMSGRGAVDMETLEKTFEIITNSIEESQKIYKENADMRDKNSQKLEEFKFKLLVKPNK